MQVTSSDGTQIHAEEVGQGPPILFVPGSTLDASALDGVTARLASRFRCLAMDRRGRGKSGDAVAYSLAQEAKDILAVCRGVGGELTLFGHSYGGLCVLEAAHHYPQVSSLILYEPPIGIPLPADLRQAIRGAFDAGDARRAMLLFLGQVVRIRPEELAFVKTLPADWFETRAATTLREMEAADDFDAERLLRRCRDLPVSLLLGSESPPEMRVSAERLLRALPHARLHTLEGQAHNALLLAPELVAQAIEVHGQRFERSSDQGSAGREPGGRAEPLSSSVRS